MTQELEQRDRIIATELVGAARDVLNVMFFSDVVEQDVDYAGRRPLPLQVRVQFSGDGTGEFRMEVDDAAACSLAGSFMGTDPLTTPSDEEVDQVMGELGNMICGSFLSRYEKDGLFSLSSPEVLRPATGELAGVHQGLELMEGFLDLRVQWGAKAA